MKWCGRENKKNIIIILCSIHKFSLHRLAQRDESERLKNKVKILFLECIEGKLHISFKKFLKISLPCDFII